MASAWEYGRLSIKINHIEVQLCSPSKLVQTEEEDAEDNDVRVSYSFFKDLPFWWLFVVPGLAFTVHQRSV